MGVYEDKEYIESKMMNAEIKSIIFNWFTTDQGASYQIREVGTGGVERIVEHEARGEGDKWHYDVFYEDGTIERIFNVNYAVFKPKGDKDGGW